MKTFNINKYKNLMINSNNLLMSYLISALKLKLSSIKTSFQTIKKKTNIILIYCYIYNIIFLIMMKTIYYIIMSI